MSSHKGKRSRKGNYTNTKHGNDTPSTSRSDVDDNSPVIKMFRECQCTLDKKHDKHERLVKLSRDITIESKRIIFQLHRISGSPNPEELMKESEVKLKELQTTKWKSIAIELHSEDPYQYLRAYSPGLQEYIEAVSFLYYLKEKGLVSLEEVNKELKYTVERIELSQSKQQNVEKAPQPKNTEESASSIGTTESETAESTTDKELVHISVHIPPMEYMLGIADLTGELMRMAIMSVGSGDLELPFELCSFMRVIHDAFVLFGNIQRELPRKLSTLKASLKKVENACYTLQVRGSEIPKHMLKDVFSSGVGNESAVDIEDYGGD